MPIRQFAEFLPKIDASTFVDETAVVIGDVTLGAESSIWPMCVLRGDINSIHIGHHTNLQDGTVVHVTHDGPHHPGGFKTHIGNHVIVGHRVVLHGCEVHDHVLIGMTCVLMDGAVVESDVIIGAGSLVTPGKVLESGYLWMGTPARKVRKLTDKEKEEIRYGADYYAKLKEKYR